MFKANSLVTTRKRLLVIIITIAFLFCVLFGRLTYIQIFQGSELQARATDQWYRDLPLRAQRGIIYDCNGSKLADNRDVYSIYVRPNAMKDAERVSVVLSELLGLDQASLYTKITTTKVSEITIKRQVPTSVAELIKQCDLDGVYYAIDSKRNYPNSDLLSQVIGFTNIDNEGQSGLEAYYNKYLKGVDGMVYTETDIKGTELEGSVASYVPSIPGCDLTLTVDENIQSFADTAVHAAKEEWNAKSASMIVMDVDTGGIVAMATAPDFDLNNVPRDNIDALNALSKNSMIVDVYEPGSTFKIFTTATALANGVTDVDDTFYCPGYRIVDGQRIKCWRYIGHGNQTLSDGVKNSCNCVFMDLAQRLGTERLYDGLEAFGFGAKTNVDFYGESSGILMSEASVKTVDLARIGFGQAVAVTPLQLVNGVCAVVNGGTLYEPYFVSSINSNGTEIYRREPKAVRKVLDEKNCELMKRMLGRVVSEGGGKKAQPEGFAVGGKTGTAQKYGNGGIAAGKYVSSFVGFAPLDDPKYALLMIVDEPNSYAYYGSVVAAPYAGEVFGKIFAYLGMKPTLGPDTYTFMPELTGKPLSESVLALKEAKLNYELVGEGSIVSATVPVAGTKMPEGDVAVLKLV